MRWQWQTHRTVALLCALGAALALAVALGSEHFLGLAPCALCLVERMPYKFVLPVGVVAMLMPRFAARILLVLIALLMLGSVAAATVHVGVEQEWWKSPLPECAAPHITGRTVAELLKQLPARPNKPCDAPSYLVPHLPVSMALMNLVYSVVFFLLLSTYILRMGRSLE